MRPTENVVGEVFICGRFQAVRGKGCGNQLSKLTLACDCGGAAGTGLGAKLLAMPGSLVKFLFGEAVFGFSLAHSLGAPL